MNKCKYMFSRRLNKGLQCAKATDKYEDYCPSCLRCRKGLYYEIDNIFKSDDIEAIKNNIHRLSNNQINHGLSVASSQVAKYVLTQSTFFPFTVEYKFMLKFSTSYPYKDVELDILYKRFLIISYLEQIVPQDVISQILDIDRRPINKPYYYTQFMLQFMSNPNRINFGIRIYSVKITEALVFSSLVKANINYKLHDMGHHIPKELCDYVARCNNEYVYIFGLEVDGIIHDLTDSNLEYLASLDFEIIFRI